ncbi:MAG: PIN domain-containing protein [Nanoarchaeota archaeon]
MNKAFFFDTYAIIEINKGNPAYKKYAFGVKIILSKLNILEYIYFLIREKKESQIEEAFSKLSKFNVDYDDKILLDAAKMKFKFVKEKLSFVDCIGYYIAKKYNCKFLTGDEKFKNKENVEFVK